MLVPVSTRREAVGGGGGRAWDKGVWVGPWVKITCLSNYSEKRYSEGSHRGGWLETRRASKSGSQGHRVKMEGKDQWVQ